MVWLLAILGGLTLPKWLTGAFPPQPEPIRNTPAAPAEMTVHDSHDLDVLARTLWGEARGEGRTGMIAVANVIMNRYRLAQQSSSYARQFGRSVAECTWPHDMRHIWELVVPHLPFRFIDF